MRSCLPIALFAAGAALYACASQGHAADPSDWQAWNRQFNQLHPLRNDGLPWALEGIAGYDCKGSVAAKIKDLRARGVGLDRMLALVVSNGSPSGGHMVLQVETPAGVQVFDNLSPWPQRRSDYQIILTVSPSTILKFAGDRDAVSPVIRQIESAR